jgi:hypothetical protein
VYAIKVHKKSYNPSLSLLEYYPIMDYNDISHNWLIQKEGRKFYEK